jgi:hypothetical protein
MNWKFNILKGFNWLINYSANFNSFLQQMYFPG